MPKHTRHCPVEGCTAVMESEAATKDEAVKDIIVKGDAHFAEAGHPMDQSMTPEMKEHMTREHMKS